MSGQESTENFNDRLDKAMSIIDNDPTLNDEQDTDSANTDPNGDGNTKPPAKDVIGEDPTKTNDTEKDKPQDTKPVAIEPPASWSGDNKEAFNSLPQWAQEAISTRESEREAYFSDRSRVLAAREQELNTLSTRAQQDQQRYATDLERASQLVQTLMPAKFSDIQSEADYLRVKVEDPQRASEYEVFTTMLRNVSGQRQQLLMQQAQQRLDNEWTQLQSKYPEFKDATKADTILGEVRKTLVESYGFNAQEVETIADHRHVQIVRDAIAWKRHLAAVKAAESKRVTNNPTTPAVRQNGSAGSANLNAEQKSKVLTRASGETDLRKKADMLASLIV